MLIIKANMKKIITVLTEVMIAEFSGSSGRWTKATRR
jgi:hypothetical protein